MVGIETDLVNWLQHRARRSPSVHLGIGDDMAVVRAAGHVLLSCDMLLDGIHFDTAKHDLRRIGRKAVACSLSDCAAMAVMPQAVTVSVALPTGFTLNRCKELFEGMFSMADEHGVSVVGGDTTVWQHPLVIDIAITAVPYDGIEPVRRSGAKVSDGIFVTGRLGGSILGRQLDFTPRVREAKALAAALGGALHAMMDISDGLSLDLWRLCQASGVGAIVDEPSIEKIISNDARRLSESDGKRAIDHALSDGEDFELLFTSPIEPNVAGVDVTRVGTITESGYQIRRADGTLEVILPSGYVHG